MRRHPRCQVPTSEATDKNTIGFAGEQRDPAACAEWTIVTRRRPEEQARAERGQRIERGLHIKSAVDGLCARVDTGFDHAKHVLAAE